MRHQLLRYIVVCVLLGLLASCQRSPAANSRPLMISAIPDQDPEKLQRLYGGLAAYLSKALGEPVEYKPVTDYKAAVTAFKVGDLDLVWFGGLTGVQARLQRPESQAILQRDIDENFKSVFIANAVAGIKSLADLKGKTFTFGSESSTSGRLMPQYFLEREGVRLTDFKATPGFSGSHDKTIELVAAGSFDAGAVNEQVWQKRVASQSVDTSRVTVISTTPPYHDYHWVLSQEATRRFGEGLRAKIVTAFKSLSADNPEHASILDLFGAKRFIETSNDNYQEIERVGRSAGLIVGDAERASR